MSDAAWSSAWLTAVGSAGRSYADRLGRGPYYVARGAVKALEVTPGMATATFLHGRQRSQQVAIQVAPLDDDAWQRMVAALAAELRFSAAITEGTLPPEALPLLDDIDVALVPRRGDITESCRCHEGDGDPCRHIASVHHALSRLLDRDPFALLTLRSRDAATLRASLRAARTGEDLATASRSPDAVAIAELEGIDMFGARGDLDDIPLHPRLVDDPAWLFDQLGDPPGIDDPAPLERLIVRAADTAWRLAAGDGAEAADTELLLTELRAQRMSTPTKLAEALGWDAQVVASALDELYEANAVMRMGSGLDAKYRAAS